jgi:hypothetical protein
MKKFIILVLSLIIVFSGCKSNEIQKENPKEKPEEPVDTPPDKYIVFFLTNTSVDQADEINTGKDADTRYTFVGEIPQIFGELKKDGEYKFAYGLCGPMLLTQSVSEMTYEVNKAFDIAEKYNVPVYFQLDDCNNYTKEFGSGAMPKFYQNPDWCEWVDFPENGEDWGGQSNGRLPYYWFNWGAWMHADAFPCFNSPDFRKFVSSQLNEGFIHPLINRYKRLCDNGKEYLFAGLAVGWETHIPDYSGLKNNLPVNVLANDQMPPWEATQLGYHALHNAGYKEYNRNILYFIIHEYIEFISKTVNEAGIPRNKIFTHIVGITSAYPNMESTSSPPIWTAVNDYSIPGYTLSPESCPYNLDVLKAEIRKADKNQKYFGLAEGYSRGVNGSIDDADRYFSSMFGNGALLVSVFGWGRETSDSQFAVSHSKTSPFVQAAKKWIDK